MIDNERVKQQVIGENYRAGLMIENSLLKKINGGYLLENMLKNNVDFSGCEFNQRESLRLILKYKRYDLLENVTIRNLLRKRNKKETFLDYILELSKKDKSINISLYDPFNGINSLKNIADFYIIYAKHGLLDYLPPLTDQLLTKKENNPILRALTFNQNFLSILLKRGKDRDFVKKKMLSKGLIRDLDVILTLNDDEEYVAPLEIKDQYSKKYYDEQNSTIESVYNYLRPKEQELIDKLHEVMVGRCDDEAINTVLYSFIEQIHYGDKTAIYAEIRKLIDVFKYDDTFTIVMGDDSHFSPIDNRIMLANMSTTIFNHELGHLFYHKLTRDRKDPRLFEIIDNIKNNPQTLDKVDALSSFYQEVKAQIKKKAIEYYERESEDEFTPEIEAEIESRLSTKKEELLKEYRRRGYSKAVIENVLNRTYTLEEYKNQHRQIEISELRDSIRRTKAGPMNQIADIVDAIYKGAFKSGKLVNSSGKRIRPVTGHGLFYYNSSQEAVFDEMFANYCALRKNNEIGVTYYIDPVKGPIDNGIECLRAIVGDELVDYLEDFYQQKIVKSDSSLIARSR